MCLVFALYLWYVVGTVILKCSIFLYFTGKIFSGWHSSPPLSCDKIDKFLLDFMANLTNELVTNYIMFSYAASYVSLWLLLWWNTIVYGWVEITIITITKARSTWSCFCTYNGILLYFLFVLKFCKKIGFTKFLNHKSHNFLVVSCCNIKFIYPLNVLVVH